MSKEIFIERNRITLQATILGCSEAAVHSHSLSKILQKILVVESFFWSNYRLTVQSSDYTKMTPPRMFSWKSSAWTVQK